MKRLGGVLLLTMLFPLTLFAEGLTLSPSAIVNGGVALLRWQGELPSVAVARFNGRSFYLSPAPDGAVALVGADVQLEPGDYPLEAAVVDRQGESTFYHLKLKVSDARRASEELSLPSAMVSPRKPEVIERIRRERALLDELFFSRSERRLWESFRRPVDDPLGSPFGLRRILNGKPRSPHSGVDFRSPAGTPVHASAAGRVVFAGNLFFTGNTVILDHGNGLFTYYAHLRSISVEQAGKVEAGAVVGEVGSTGRATGPHLHWGGKLRGDRIDPLALMALPGMEKP